MTEAGNELRNMRLTVPTELGRGDIYVAMQQNYPEDIGERLRSQDLRQCLEDEEKSMNREEISRSGVNEMIHLCNHRPILLGEKTERTTSGLSIPRYFFNAG